MIIVQLTGGLGNQMFQYALGRHLSIRHGCELKLDKTLLSVCRLRDYSLGCMKIVENFASEDEIRQLKYGYQNYLMYLICHFAHKAFAKLNLKSPLNKKSFFEEANLDFSPEVFTRRGSLYLAGYWQSEKYFASIRNTLMSDFSIKLPQNEENRKISEKIMESNSVSLHVRRGDYISNPETRKLHCCCDDVYYQNALNYILEEVTDPHFFVFSDEPQWVVENFKLPGKVTVIDKNDPSQAHEDLRLMSQCQHNILANSSFSWWGAWLNNNPGKIVVAPKNWFNSSDMETKDRIPVSWVIV